MASTFTLLSGARLGLVGRVAITRQDNDLTKPETTQNSFTTTFTLSDAYDVHRAVEHAAAGTSATTIPYQQLAGTLDTAGVELIPRALLQLQSYEPRVGYSAQVFGGNKSFYSALGDKKLAELDLSRFSHDWTPANIFAGLNRPADAFGLGYCYDLVDRGKGDPCTFTAATASAAGYYSLGAYAGELYPSIFARAVFDQIFAEAGFQWVGSLPDSFNRQVLAPTGKFGYSQETRTAYSVLAGWRHPLNSIRDTRDQFNETIPYNYTGGNSFAVGKLAAFNPVTHSATVKVTGKYNLGAKLEALIECDALLPGRVGIVVLLRVNGVEIARDEMSTGDSVEDILNARFENYELTKGDVVDAVVYSTEESGLFGAGPYGTRWQYGYGGVVPGGYLAGSDVVEPPNNFALEITLLEEFAPGGLVSLIDWLPDLMQKDFIKGVIQQFALQQRPHPYIDQIEFLPVAGLFDRLGDARAIDKLIDQSRPSKVSYQLGSFAQNNWLRWKADAANPTKAAGLGDVALPCPDASLDAKKDIITLPYAASPAGANGLVLLPSWQADAGSDPVTFSAQKLEPRTLLRSTTRSREVALLDDTPSATLPAPTPAVVGTATIPVAYFVEASEPVDLDFGRTLAPTFYTVLAAALKAPRLLKPFVRLSVDDVVNFDQLVPVWIEREGAYFYQNKIEQYEEGATTTAVELIRLTL